MEYKSTPEPIRDIGSALLDYSNNSETSARGLVTELFPYIFAASERMSTRAISNFLLSEHKVKISAATIAKALREPNRHFDALLETVKPAAQVAAGFARVSDWITLLADEEHLELLAHGKLVLKTGDPGIVKPAQEEFQKAATALFDNWFETDPKFRAAAIEYIREREASLEE